MKFDITTLLKVRDAWTIEGRRPYYHRKQKALLRRNWPALYNALVELTGEK